MPNNAVLIEYIRRPSHTGEQMVRRGALVALPNPENSARFLIGYSLCHESDKNFDRKRAVEMASVRALRMENNYLKALNSGGKMKEFNKKYRVLPEVKHALIKFLVRACIYYKGMQEPSWAEYVLGSIRYKIFTELLLKRVSKNKSKKFVKPKGMLVSDMQKQSKTESSDKLHPEVRSF